MGMTMVEAEVVRRERRRRGRWCMVCQGMRKEGRMFEEDGSEL